MAEPAKKPLRDYTEGLDGALLRQHAHTDSKLKEDASKIASERQNFRKKMKADGFDLEAYDLAMRFQKLDPVEAVIRLNRAICILKFLNAPVGAQLNFIDMIDDNVPVSDAERAERWKSEGTNAFIMGKREIDCPYAANLPSGQAWMQGFREAESEALAAKTKAELSEPNPVDTVGSGDAPARGRRGRPPGAKNKPRVVVDNTRAEDGEPAAPPAPEAVAEDAPPAPPAPDAPPMPSFDDPPAPPEI